MQVHSENDWQTDFHKLSLVFLSFGPSLFCCHGPLSGKVSRFRHPCTCLSGASSEHIFFPLVGNGRVSLLLSFSSSQFYIMKAGLDHRLLLYCNKYNMGHAKGINLAFSMELIYTVFIRI